ncbi:hypothetical protein PVIIG_06091 [Plasmodium vivax India VII]|uniref:Uncharacterized protein n=1 Tax=Plasmodium vivax India VII TaxID=1077284 RepID=A0A0J9S2W6_PLAVI|nr:hypothetical protein PVIIG_06091 [Plasmodium vivax India VII]
MSKDITDIENWKDDYPFLEKVWETYKKFDNTTEDGNNNYDVICGSYILNQINEEASRHKGFCIRLMKNLRYFSSEDDYYNLTQERCNILFNWMYKLMNEQNITSNIIYKLFERYNEDMQSQKNHNICHYFQYNKIHKPINITLLDIFNDNISNIETALKKKDSPSRNTGRNFVCECVKIYKDMNNLYCANGRGINDDYSSVCLKLTQFKSSYMSYLYYKDNLSSIIPSLDNINNDLFAKCPEYEKRLELGSDGRKTQERYSENGLNPATEGQRIFSEAGRTTNLGDFTPAGRLVNPKLRTTGMINNNFYGDDANGMLFDGNEHNGFNSYNIGYEAV